MVSIEGVEGSGKSTQVRRLAARLRARGIHPVVTKEPGGTALGKQLRSLLLASSGLSVVPVAELLLYVADRAQHVSEVVRPALEQGALVLCDRYRDATLAYQGYGRGLPLGLLRELHAHPPLDLLPDRTLLLDLDPESALARARMRNRRLGLEAAEGRFERETIAFHRKVRDGYLELAAAEPQRLRVIPADGGIDEVGARVEQALRDLLPALGAEGPP
jgi:dTMP kinase